MKPKTNIVIIGTGNVATQLALALHEKKFNIIQIVGRKEKDVLLLSKKIKTAGSTNFNNINSNADIYILAIKDDAINSLASKLKLKDKLIVHTSGTVDLNVLKSPFSNYGVFYPLQTLSKNKKIDFKNVPICIEANNKKAFNLLFELANTLSDKVYKINSEQRKIIHLAAVFACNFSNYMYVIADDILSKNKLSFDLLKPLIAETAEKIKSNKPFKNQTGPAVRKDTKTMKAHLKMLENNKSFKKIYENVSDGIMKTKKKKK